MMLRQIPQSCTSPSSRLYHYQKCIRFLVRTYATTGQVHSPVGESNGGPALSLEGIPLPPHLQDLSDRLCALDLVQTAQLVASLKRRLNLPDMMTMPMAAVSSATSAPTTATNTAAAPPVEEQKTEFSVTLVKFDAASKAKIIREIKTILPQMNLVEAKAFVEGAPKMIKEKAKREEAEKIKKTLEELGATISLE